MWIKEREYDELKAEYNELEKRNYGCYAIIPK